jgi:soluble lytic murein transglycosylase-like protein
MNTIIRIFVVLGLVIYGLFILAVNCHADEIEDIIPHLIAVESSGNPNAVSKAGAVGLCQITPIVLEEFIKSDYPLLDCHFKEKKDWNILDMKCPICNKYVAKWYLRRLRDHYIGNTVMAYRPNTFTTYKSVVNLKGWSDINTCKDYEIALVLAAYNGGITRLRACNYDINKMPKETRDYVKKIMKLYSEAKKK